MNKNPIDKSKKANIKCEHCQFWNSDVTGCGGGGVCDNPDSPKYAKKREYYNRCMVFSWKKTLHYK